VASDVLKGNFNPDDFEATIQIEDPYLISENLINEIKPNNLKEYLEKMSSFHTRNTVSDTVSTTRGIGAARNWALAAFQKISDDNENRLIPTFLKFEQTVCGVSDHKNILAILPGTGPQFDESILVEAHFDSRCATLCDPDCEAHGMEDNGSGSALVLELARVMSKYSFNRTIIFMLTVGEEQGLIGAEALATWCQDNDIKLVAVFNNDIVGGVLCGNTASPPGCPEVGTKDTTNVRLYSAGNFNSANKQLVRWTKLQQKEMIIPHTSNTNTINIMTPEDRSGRGGDHIPFPPKGFKALRFTSAYEHGDGNPAQDNYMDRQHTSDDVLGVDTDTNGSIDSFYVDFNYLSRNGVINGNAIAVASTAPIPPVSFDMTEIPGGFQIDIDDPNDYGEYRVAIRDIGLNTWDTLITVNSKTASITGLSSGFYVLSACTVDDRGIESFFSNEIWERTTGPTATKEVERLQKKVHLMQNRPNPFDEVTNIVVVVEEVVDHKEAKIMVVDLEGQVLVSYPIKLRLGINEIMYEHKHHGHIPGVYAYSLVIDGQIVETKRMIYAN